MSQPSHSDIGDLSSDSDRFLVQKVCVDTNNRPIAIDPINCSGRGTLRSLEVGETLPYRKHDRPTPGNPRGYQYSDSFPLPDGTGTTHYVSSMYFADGITLEAEADRLDYNPNGYNIISTKQGVASFVGTNDWSGPQAFYGPGCKLEKSWELFPLSLRPGQTVAPTAQLKLIRSPQKCDSSTLFDKSYSPATFLSQPFEYTSGKRLRTIMTTHYGAATPSLTASIPGAGYEMTYYTELYGLTRWEAWQREQDVTTVGGDCNGPVRRVDQWGNRWARVGCRDWSFVSTTDIDDEPVQFSPYSVYLDTPFHSANLLKGSDFRRGIGSWRRYQAPHQINWVIQRDPKNNRRHLAVSCPGNCNGHTFFQEVAINTQPGQFLTFGLQGWVANATASGVIQIFQYDSGRNLIQSDRLRVTLNQNKEKQFGSTVARNRDARFLTWAFYPEQGNTNYFITNPWLVLENRSRTVGSGTTERVFSTACQVEIKHCPRNSSIKPGLRWETVNGAGTNQNRCLARASDYKRACGSTQPITARYFVNKKVVAQTSR